MLKLVGIELVETDWTSLIRFDPKKDGSLPYCIDDRKLKAVTARDSYPFPRLDEYIQSPCDAIIFFTIDANRRYW